MSRLSIFSIVPGTRVSTHEKLDKDTPFPALTPYLIASYRYRQKNEKSPLYFPYQFITKSKFFKTRKFLFTNVKLAKVVGNGENH